MIVYVMVYLYNKAAWNISDIFQSYNNNISSSLSSNLGFYFRIGSLFVFIFGKEINFAHEFDI